MDMGKTQKFYAMVIVNKIVCVVGWNRYKGNKNESCTMSSKTLENISGDAKTSIMIMK